VPHCGHLFPSGMGWFDFTVSMPPSEAKPEERYKIFRRDEFHESLIFYSA